MISQGDSVSTILLWNYAALMLNIVAFVIIYMKANRNKALKLFFRVQFLLIIWLLGKILKTVSFDVETRWFFICFYYFGIIYIAPSFLDFSFALFAEKFLKKKIRILIYTIATIEYVITVTNPLHYLFYSTYTFQRDDFGIIFFIITAINYTMIIFGIYYSSLTYKKRLKEKSSKQSNLISLSIIIPLIINVLYIMGILKHIFRTLNFHIFDITPICYTISILIFVYTTFKYDFIRLSPIIKPEIVNIIDYPLLILNKELQVVYTNDSFNKCFTDKKQIIDTICIKKIKIIKQNNHYYKYDIKENNKLLMGKFIVRFSDITKYESTKNELKKETNNLTEINKKLKFQIEKLKETSHIGARTYISRELHDILGHSLVVTIKLLEVAKLYHKTNRQRALESLESAQIAIDNGFNEMKEITKNEKFNQINTDTLGKELKGILKILETSDIKTSFFIRGENITINSDIYNTIKKIVIELVTNSIKHSKASTLLLSISISEKNISLQIMDNGIGCSSLKKGNGLKGIETRIELVKGTISYSTGKDEGFTCSINIPI